MWALEKQRAAQRHVTYTVVENGTGLDDLRVRGVLVLASLRLLGEGPAEADRDGAVIKVERGGARLMVHDEPGGLVSYRGDAGLALTFPADASIQMVRAGAAVTLAGGQRILVVAKDVERSGNTLTVAGFASLHAPPGEAKGPGDLAARIEKAVEDRRLGAKVHLTRLERSPSEGAVEVRAYDDVDVTVEASQGAPTEEDPIRVRVGGELPEGRTVVVDVAPSLLPSTGQPLRLRYFDVHEDGSRTEVLFLQASSLDDVLDAKDDGGQPEYWVVEDADGTHVMASVPHFSVHEFTISASALAPSVALGLSAGLVATLMAAVILLRPRRRDE